MIAYRITNKQTGKSYIGITIRTVEDRWHRHCLAAVRQPLPDYALSRAIRKYGPDAFEIEAIASAKTKADLFALETLLIAQHQTLLPGGYNHTKGGEGVIGVPRDQQYRSNISAAMTGVWSRRSAEQRHAIAKKGSAANQWKATPEYRAKLSAAMTGKPKSASHRAAIARGKIGNQNALGHVQTDAHRAAIAASRMGHEVSPETRAKISASLSGRKRRSLDTTGGFVPPQHGGVGE